MMRSGALLAFHTVLNLSVVLDTLGFTFPSPSRHAFPVCRYDTLSDGFVENYNREMLLLAKDNIEFSNSELDSSLESFKSISELAKLVLNYQDLRALIREEAHLSFKSNFHRTDEATTQLQKILGSPSHSAFQRMFDRVLVDGNWDKAVLHASSQERANDSLPNACKPWAVLVTGLNGIRKTTSINSPWFQEILHESLESQLSATNIAKDQLPAGSNSFFRQLDFIIATVANNEFRRLYCINDVKSYALFKNAIFTRYRTLAEIVGMLLVRSAKVKKMNVLIETSGRDIASFEYMDYLFPAELYNKLVVHFTINDIKHAERSVDKRMIEEMRQGKVSLQAEGGVLSQIRANAGGPYGSQQLKSVQQDSDTVLNKILTGQSNVGKDWFKARILICASEDSPWTAQADTKGSTVFPFPLH